MQTSSRKFAVTPVSGDPLTGSNGGPQQQPSPNLPRARPSKLPFASIPEDHPLHVEPRPPISRSQSPAPADWDFDETNHVSL